MKWWSTAAQWRNWPLQVKLGMVLVVPVVGALVLGVLRVQDDATQARMYDGIARIATLRVQLVTTLTSIQDERNAAVRHGRDLTRLAGITDAETARTAFVAGNTPDLGANAARRLRNLTGSLSLLPYARGRVAAGADGGVVVIAYNAVTNAVLEFDRALVGRFPDEALTSSSIALNELQSAREQVGIQQAAGLVALRNGTIGAADRSMIVEGDVRLDDSLTDFHAVAMPGLLARYDATVTGTDVAKRQLLVLAARTPGGGRPPFTQKQWDTAFTATTALMGDVTGSAAAELRDGSAALAERFSRRAGIASLLLLTMVLLAAGIGGVLGRYLLRSVGVLRRTALDVARTKLPAAVESIRAGERVRIEPVPVHTTDEFGQLARAFDAVHAQAVRAAAEEASLRGNLAGIFTNLSHRSQGLVERQLRLMEQLEQKEDDPDQLANLFKIDHLATRMRRNNENLTVLSGAGLGRRFTEPMPLPDVLRAAVSEVEHYERVVIGSAPGVRVLGYAAGDLIRSVSELIENATRFSPPERPVEIASRRNENGTLLIDILDEGVGMGPGELREANERVAAGGGVDVPVSRQLGLFVVGRLTVRHGMRVRLAGREGRDGLCASLLVPASLVAGEPGGIPLPAPARPAEAISEPATAVAGRLHTAGIDVELHDVPTARTPAAILFEAVVPAEPVDSSFTWLHRGGAAAEEPAETPRRVAPTPLMEYQTGPNGPPRRRDAERARGFLTGFQAGVRQNETRKGAREE